MPTNLPGPYELEFSIRVPSTPNREHVHRINCNMSGSPAAGSLFPSILAFKKSGGTVALDVAANLYWSFVRQLYSTTSSCFGVTLWKYVTGTRAKNFISAYNVTTPAGAAGVMVEAQQITLSFRSALGGIQKLIYMEGNVAGKTRTTLLSNAAGTASERIASYMMSADNITLAADDSYCVAPLRLSLGENEAINSRIYR